MRCKGCSLCFSWAAGFPLLAKRVYTSKQMSRTCPIQPSGSMLRPMNYKAWTEEQMSLAHQAYTTHKHSVCRIAEEYGIPKSTCKTELVAKFCLAQKVARDVTSVRKKKKKWLAFWLTVLALVSLAVAQK